MKAGVVKLAIQELLGIPKEVQAQNIGPKTRAAFEKLANTPNDIEWPPEGGEFVDGLASAFAYYADIVAFRQCKAQGKSDQQCFKVGDNGIGLWGDKTYDTDRPMCALPREDWEKLDNPRGKLVEVRANGRTIVAELRDTMPRKANITNGAVIDLNPVASEMLGLKVPFMVPVLWRWLPEVKPEQV